MSVDNADPIDERRSDVSASVMHLRAADPGRSLSARSSGDV